MSPNPNVWQWCGNGVIDLPTAYIQHFSPESQHFQQEYFDVPPCSVPSASICNMHAWTNRQYNIFSKEYIGGSQYATVCILVENQW